MDVAILIFCCGKKEFFSLQLNLIPFFLPQNVLHLRPQLMFADDAPPPPQHSVSCSNSAIVKKIVICKFSWNDTLEEVT